VVAKKRWLEGGPVADAPASDASADLGDDTRGLVSQHRRIRDLRVTERALGERVHVRAADTDRLHLHLYLAWLRIGRLAVDQPKLANTNKLGDPHAQRL